MLPSVREGILPPSKVLPLLSSGLMYLPKPYLYFSAGRNYLIGDARPILRRTTVIFLAEASTT